MGWSVGRGVPSPLKKGSGEGAVPPPKKNFFLKFFWFNVFQKFLCSGQRGGGIAQCPPPKYATEPNHHLPQSNPDWFYFSGTRPIQIVVEKWPLNGRVRFVCAVFVSGLLHAACVLEWIAHHLQSSDSSVCSAASARNRLGY